MKWYLSLLLCQWASIALSLRIRSADKQIPLHKEVKVPVQLGVMSRCPDALKCETVFQDVIPEVEDKVDLSLVYVANLDESDPTFGVRCMHGRFECAGNVQQLCVKKYADFQTWWNFVICQNSVGRERIGFPDVALGCAAQVGLDWVNSGAGLCAGVDGSGTASEGVDLLKESVKLGKDLEITKSCTVLINHKPVCVHDGDWKDCNNGHEAKDFVKQIEDEHSRLNDATVTSSLQLGRIGDA